MLQEELIRERLKLLADYMSDLAEVTGVSDAEFQENKILRRYIERTLHLAIEACLDIGFHIISTEGYREPSYGREVIEILADNGWISRSLERRLHGMVGFRNVLVHDYATVEADVVLNVLRTKLPDLREFGAAIATRIA